MRRLAELGLVGEDIRGHGCPGMSPLVRGLVNMELHRGDGSLGTFLGVQSGLAMKAIDLLGSEEQKARWLPAMARLEAIGAFALTEPDHGSDSVSLETSARLDGDEWVLDGAKRWIGNGSIADVAVVWARSDQDGEVKGFLVETGAPTSRPRRCRARARRGRSGRPTSGSAACACPRRRASPAPSASGTPAAC
jgi:glutaryl-CoA dehydrogenase